MELTVNRHTKTGASTIGDFLLNNIFFSYCLEPTERGLTSDMLLEQITAIKVQNKTAIPTGRYQVVKYYSPKHEAFVPLLLHVPGYAGVEIHAGNYPKDTDGCLLLGKTKDVNFVGNSQVTITKFYELFFDAINANEVVYITYKDK